MTVLSVAYPLFPVARDSGGGAEQILYLLEREITRAGHCSVVIGARGSNVTGELIEPRGGHLAAILEAILRYKVDLIHFHGLDFHSYVPETRVPMLATLHLPLGWYPKSIFDLRGVRLVCVSRSQAAETGLTVTPNGVDTTRFHSSEKKGNYLFWLGRICPEKGVHIALRVARRLELPIIIAGPVHEFESHQRYFRDEVAPLLDSTRVYIGAIEDARKSTLLAEARCVLIPSLAAETSSLVAMEALTSGTPVVALRSGALPEVVENGVTGFIADSEEGMAEAVKKIHTISAETCRSHALARFDARRMAKDYFGLYEELVSRCNTTRHFSIG